MMYMSIGQIIRIHFMVGVCFGIGAAVYARYKGRPRRWLVFGGEPFSFGDQKQWLRWYVIAFIFELVTSLAPGHMLYVELALSFLEAAALVSGAFAVDRVFMIFFEMGPEKPANTGDAHHDADAVRRAFDEATKGH